MNNGMIQAFYNQREHKETQGLPTVYQMSGIMALYDGNQEIEGVLPNHHIGRA